MAMMPTHALKQRLSPIRECYVMVEAIENKKKQKDDLAAIGSGKALGCVGGPSSMPPYRPTHHDTASGSASSSAGATTHGPSTASGSGSVSIGPRIRKSKLDTFFVPCTTLRSQQSLESMGWNKEVHDAAKMAVGRFCVYGSVPFFTAR